MDKTKKTFLFWADKLLSWFLIGVFGILCAIVVFFTVYLSLAILAFFASDPLNIIII